LKVKSGNKISILSASTLNRCHTKAKVLAGWQTSKLWWNIPNDKYSETDCIP